jgi:hypothetical protein
LPHIGEDDKHFAAEVWLSCEELTRQFQRAEDTRACAMVVSVALAELARWILRADTPPVGYWGAFAIGLVATPLAPVAKDLSTALSAAVNALQTAKK